MRRMSFRVQLVGTVGETVHLRVGFADEETGEWVRIPDGDLEKTGFLNVALEDGGIVQVDGGFYSADEYIAENCGVRGLIKKALGRRASTP